eukprot:s2077_g17.t1
MWQNSPDASRSPWVQKLKDGMEKASDEPTPMGKGSEPDAEIEDMGGSDQESSVDDTSDGIPDHFMGIVDEPQMASDDEEPAASCDQGADGAGHEGESHEPSTKHIEAACAIFTDEEWG